MTNYQHMCKAAKEIQEAWEPKEGDRVYIDSLDMVLCLQSDTATMPNEEPVWLPRIEDLIAMLTPEAIKPYHQYDVGPSHNIIRAIVGWSCDRGAVFWRICRNMTVPELYLCFVMSELHSKIWDGAQWLNNI